MNTVGGRRLALLMAVVCFFALPLIVVANFQISIFILEEPSIVNDPGVEWLALVVFWLWTQIAVAWCFRLGRADLLDYLSARRRSAQGGDQR